MSDPGDLETWAQRAWASLELLHVPGYFSVECREQYKALGLHPGLAYFPVRSAALGAVPAEVVEAMFFVFAPRRVRKVLPDCWSVASPERVLAARHEGVRQTLHRILDDTLAQGPDGALDEAVQLARQACEGLTAPGRALYAGHAALPWPDEPLMQLWHAATLVREHRGDGHVAALLTAGLSPVEAMWTYGLVDAPGVKLGFLQSSRGWTEAEWQEAADRLMEQDLVEAADDGGVHGSGLRLTDSGRTLREELEETTKLSALDGWAHLGLDGTRRLAELLNPLRRSVIASGIMAPTQV
ncbi:SCO6745 family protein [Angustibacter sp. McL0619]|uniref:SCO6745 family protein n=1 Tax=Angustibacter sp. McL0619 TaxID=3415676 RepID=UPI003CEE2E0F